MFASSLSTRASGRTISRCSEAFPLALPLPELLVSFLLGDRVGVFFPLPLAFPSDDGGKDTVGGATAVVVGLFPFPEVLLLSEEFFSVRHRVDFPDDDVSEPSFILLLLRCRLFPPLPEGESTVLSTSSAHSAVGDIVLMISALGSGPAAIITVGNGVGTAISNRKSSSAG